MLFQYILLVQTGSKGGSQGLCWPSGRPPRGAVRGSVDPLVTAGRRLLNDVGCTRIAEPLRYEQLTEAPCVWTNVSHCVAVVIWFRRCMIFTQAAGVVEKRWFSSCNLSKTMSKLNTSSTLWVSSKTGIPPSSAATLLKNFCQLTEEFRQQTCRNMFRKTTEHYVSTFTELSVD